jgi:cellulose synthase/poly-beta-1,6-N-acetylglucosamine synthase-like glycosyltransferase
LSELVSIIVPVYNAAPYIEKTIEMVCEQTWPNWEMILVDDASTDDTAERIERMIGAPEPLIVGDYPAKRETVRRAMRISAEVPDCIPRSVCTAA